MTRWQGAQTISPTRASDFSANNTTNNNNENFNARPQFDFDMLNVINGSRC